MNRQPTLRHRGVQDILIAVVGGLKGFPEAITAAFPETMDQTGIARLIRHAMNLRRWTDRNTAAAVRRPINPAPTADEAARQLDGFMEKWAGKYPSVASAPRLSRGRRDPRLQRRDPEAPLHHQRCGVAAPDAEVDAENQRLFPDRGSRDQADPPSHPAPSRKADAPFGSGSQPAISWR